MCTAAAAAVTAVEVFRVVVNTLHDYVTWLGALRELWDKQHQGQGQSKALVAKTVPNTA
jgi:hypothetical protein